MRSKSKARRLTHDDADDSAYSTMDHDDDLARSESEDDADSSSEGSQEETTNFTMIPPSVDKVKDMYIPGRFEIKQSGVQSGVGVWTRESIHSGQMLGPYDGLPYQSKVENSHSMEVFEENCQKKYGVDHGCHGNWMKFVQQTDSRNRQNLMAVQVQDQIFFKAVRDIEAGEEMLLYSQESVFPDEDVNVNSDDNLDEEEKKYSCKECGEVFGSQLLQHQHELYGCRNRDLETNGLQNEGDSNGSNGSHSGSDSTMTQDRVSDDERFESPAKSFTPPYDFKNLKFPCENCERVFTDPSNLQRHIRSHHVGARCHACPECGKTFATSSGLKQHRHIHSTVKPFQCEVCHKAYTQFSNLCRHKRLHADCRQQIKCTDCGQTFSTMTSLSKHKRFCEGVLRNGGPFSYISPGSNKPAPTAPSVSQVPTLVPGYPPFFAGRPFPFYPPMGPGYPMIPPGVPPMTPPFSPGSKFNAMSQKSDEKNSEMSHAENPTTPEKITPLKSTGSEGSGSSELSSADDLESTGVSDLENLSSVESNECCTPKQAVTLHDDRRIIASPVRSLSTKSLLTPKVEIPAADEPFDLSKPEKKGSPNGDEPLDLSKKAEEYVKPHTPRKTHIFGQLTPPSLEKKLNPPPMPSPLSLEAKLRQDSEKMHHALHSLPQQMMALRHPFPIPHSMVYQSMMQQTAMAQHHSALIRPEAQRLSNMAPILKTSDAFNYSPGLNKIKDRYSCKFCGKIFPRSANLTRHLRTHTGEQPYKCKYCERSFSISSNLQRHVRNIHNKEKPYKCPVCDRCFGQQTNLDRHLKKHESEGLDITDSPVHHGMDMDDKDDSYYDQFLDKSTPEKSSPIEHSTPVSAPIDENFSITSQIQKKILCSPSSDNEQSYNKYGLNNNHRLDGMNGELAEAPQTNGFDGDVDDDCDDTEEPPFKKACPVNTPLAIAT